METLKLTCASKWGYVPIRCRSRLVVASKGNRFSDEKTAYSMFTRDRDMAIVVTIIAANHDHMYHFYIE